MLYDQLDEEQQRQIDEFERRILERCEENNSDHADAVQDLVDIATGYVDREYARERLLDTDGEH